jgi:membrane protease YdiL (CAAX protease family)
VDVQTLASDPVYLGLVFTLVSFVVAGLREELWRAGVLAGLGTLFPRQFGGLAGRFVAVAAAAVIFGLGHLPQGWGGVVVTAGLGLGLGTVMVLHRSIWEAVFAHGFFNATSFALLPLVADRLAGMPQ